MRSQAPRFGRMRMHERAKHVYAWIYATRTAAYNQSYVNLALTP